MEERVERKLIEAALAARKNAYAPYSLFYVGAALLTADGKIYTGCNVENSAFSPTSCAERTAFCKAIGEGEREFSAIAVAGGARGAETLEFCPPCGVCRQFMREFCSDGFTILLYSGSADEAEGEIQRYALKELLPVSFGREALKEKKEETRAAAKAGCNR